MQTQTISKTQQKYIYIKTKPTPTMYRYWLISVYAYRYSRKDPRNLFTGTHKRVIMESIIAVLKHFNR